MEADIGKGEEPLDLRSQYILATRAVTFLDDPLAASLQLPTRLDRDSFTKRKQMTKLCQAFATRACLCFFFFFFFLYCCYISAFDSELQLESLFLLLRCRATQISTSATSIM